MKLLLELDTLNVLIDLAFKLIRQYQLPSDMEILKHTLKLLSTLCSGSKLFRLYIVKVPKVLIQMIDLLKLCLT